MNDTTVIDTESQRKIYIASRGSSAMALEEIAGEGKSIGHHLGTYLTGTKEEIGKEYMGNESHHYFNPDYAKTQKKYMIPYLTQATAACCLSFIGGYYIPSDESKMILGVSAYLLADTLWRIRPSSIELGGVSSGIIGSVKGAIKGIYGRKQRKTIPAE